MTLRAVFHDREDADAVAARLASDGFVAEVAQVRFAGEDDDEDHPWAVATDAPSPVLELLAEQRDGWVVEDDAPSPGALPGPLELPDGPRRVKGHWPS